MNRLGIWARLGIFGGLLFLGGLCYTVYQSVSGAATITTGYTFSAGETNITHTKLNQAVNGATLSGVATADINNSAVTGAKIAANTIPGSKLQTNAVSGGVGGQINSNTVTSYNIKTGTLNGTEFSNVVDFASGIYNFTNSVTLNFSTGQIASAAIAGTNTGGTATQAALVPKLNNAGKLDSSLYYAPTATNVVISAAVSASTAYATVLSYTSSITNGMISVQGVVQYTNSSTGAGALIVAVDNGSGTVFSGGKEITAADYEGEQIPFNFMDTLTGSAKTYTVKAKISGSGGAWAKTGTLPNSAFPFTNATQMNILEIPR